jgi:MFS transporter, DHA1 family, inner membrane transport protein
MNDLRDGELDPPAGADSTTKADSIVRRREMLILLTLASVQFTSIVDFMVVMPLGPQLIRTFKIIPAQFGLIVSSYTISAGVAGFLASSLMDRFGRKAAFLTLYCGFLIGTLLCGLVNTYHALLAARVVTGAFGGILGGMALAIIGDVFPEERRGRATGILMSAFALASVVGVPIGIYFGNEYGWNVPFLILAGLGAPVLIGAYRALPPLRDHLNPGAHAHPLVQIRETFSHPNHLRAFALTLTVMLGGFTVIPFISVYLVANAGVPEKSLPLIYVTGGILTLLGAPIIGRLADHYGKLPVYRVVALLSAFMMLAMTNLPRVHLAIAVGTVGLLMLSNAGRMVAALAMVTGSVEPRRRGGFMSANSAVQHMATGLGAYLGGKILDKAADGRLLHFDWVGYIAVSATLLSLWLAGRVRPAQVATPVAHEKPAADEVFDDPLAAAELL